MEGKPAASKLSMKQRGATLAEFVIIAPVVLIIGMTTVQAGLIYHGKTTLNYATFEAARTGATNNAQFSLMRQELGLRLAPLEGGDGSAQGAATAMAKSSASVMDASSTRMKILNPTTAAFDDWGINSRESDRRVLPNVHLRHREHRIGDSSGLSLRDANLLKIEVTHGMDLAVPFVNALISQAMLMVDPENASFYRRNKFPIKSVATVRMQSEAWEDEIVLASLPPVTDEEPSDGSLDTSEGSTPVGNGDDPGTGEGVEGGAGDETAQCDGGEFGLGESPVLMDASDYAADGQCPATDPVYGSPGGVSNQCG
ncbi:TadE family protein [Granulosicoccus sp. 3-233]|uniref:TadE family protein n=1 Tax=Granulosicoccus sp. 3-233 TaxID=3417969 RepID=UPI003D33780C